jgi:hypothetical protein
MMFSVRTATAVALCFFVAACGGGGGGSGGGGGGSSGTLSVSSNSLTFIANGPSANAPAPQNVSGTVTGVSSGTLFVTIVGTGNAIAGISPVTLVSNTTGQATVTVPSPSTLGVGTYTGVITVRACTSDPQCSGSNLQGSPQTINVTYHVAALQSSAASLAYSIGNTPAAGDTSRQMTITGFPAQTWTASTNANWLSVTASGGNGAVLTASLVQNVVDGLNNGTYTGSITLTPGTAGQPLVIPVELVINRTQINYVSPYVSYSGTPSNVIIRGEEFSQVTIQDVLFGTTPAQSFNVVNATEIRATLPSSLPLGRHTVKLQSNFAGVRELADVVVVNAPVFAAAALPYPNSVDKTVNTVVYDAERAALGISVHYQFTGATDFIHFGSVANAWQPGTATSLTNHFGLAMSADGKDWIAGHYRDLMHIDAQTLATSTPVTSPLFGSGIQVVAEMAVSNDGTVAVFGDVFFGCGAQLMLYDPRKRVYSSPGFTPCRGNVAASGDGSRLLIANQFPDFGSDDVLSLNTATGATAPTGIHLLTGAATAMDRTGSRIVLNKTRVYDGSYTHLGDLPATTDVVVLSPDGTRAYAYDSPDTLRTYDLASPPVAGVFQEIGSGITLAADPGRRPASYTEQEVAMTLTPDGGTVFIAGNQFVVVQPTP